MGLRFLVLLLLCASLSGCERGPSVDIFGSFFPVWFFCILGGIVLMLISRAILIWTRLDQEIGPLVIMYPCLAALYSFILWFIFFP
jgi:hypothetical protein